ncbi:MAG: hypothetical protein ACT4QB_18340, partial [Gammaproteobacteria bacterium]
MKQELHALGSQAEAWEPADSVVDGSRNSVAGTFSSRPYDALAADFHAAFAWLTRLPQLKLKNISNLLILRSRTIQGRHYKLIGRLDDAGGVRG